MSLTGAIASGGGGGSSTPSTGADPFSVGNLVLTGSTVRTTAGNALNTTATAPAQVAASGAGVGVAITASAATAGASVAGAAAGGAVTITAGAAARFTSGNANGGDVTLTPGAGIGTGTSGNVNLGGSQVLIPAGTVLLPALAFSAASTRGIYANNGGIFFAIAGVNKSGVDSNGNLAVGSSTQFLFASSPAPDGAGSDLGLRRVAIGVAAFSDAGTTSNGWMQWRGESYLAGNGTNATATLATTGLSVTVTTGRKYGFRATIFIVDSVAAEGIKLDCGGGAATVTNFRAHYILEDSALRTSTQSTALATAVTAATFTGDGLVIIEGSFEPSSTGTFTIQYAQNSHTSGTATIYRGSNLLMWDMP